jgi:hypothetical protein
MLSIDINIVGILYQSSAIDHRTWKTGLPVRSVVLKPCAGWLVVGWVTTSEYQLLIVLLFLLLFHFCRLVEQVKQALQKLSTNGQYLVFDDDVSSWNIL